MSFIGAVLTCIACTMLVVVMGGLGLYFMFNALEVFKLAGATSVEGWTDLGAGVFFCSMVAGLLYGLQRGLDE